MSFRQYHQLSFSIIRTMDPDETEQMDLSFEGFCNFLDFSFEGFQPPWSSTASSSSLVLMTASILTTATLPQFPTAILEPNNNNINLSPEQFLEESLEDIPLPCFIEDEVDEIPEYIYLYNASSRGHHVVADSNGYEYTYKETNSKGEIWRCPKRDKHLHCNAVYHPGRKDKHGNPKDPRGRKKNKHKCAKKHKPEFVRKLRRDLKREGLLNLLDTAKSIVKLSIKNQLTDEERKLFTNLPSDDRLAAQVNYYRRQVRPQQIKHLQFEMNHSCIPEGFLQADINDGENRHVIFATSNQLKYMSNAVTWYVDGTFKIVKVPFIQLFSVHVFVKAGLCSTQVPVAFVMMSGRSAQDYDSVFKALHDLVPDAKVKRIVMDFEKATWASLYGLMSRNEFPEVTLRGCFFHFCQAVFRRIQNLGMKNQYVRDLGTKDICRRMMSLPLLPHECIPAAFQQLKQRCDDSGLENLQKFAEYMRKNWIEGWFGPATWGCFMELIRTNNHVEGYHRGLNSRVRGTHVNFYSLVQVLHEEALDARAKAIEVEQGQYTVSQALPQRKRNEDLGKLWEQLKLYLTNQPGGLSPQRFLANASKKTDPVYNWDGSRVDLDEEDEDDL